MLGLVRLGIAAFGLACPLQDSGSARESAGNNRKEGVHVAAAPAPFKYGEKHKITSPYHLQANGQAELANREIKQILEKSVTTRRDWTNKLDDALWAHPTAYKTRIGMSPYQLIFGKSYHLPVEIERKAYWATRRINFEFKEAGYKRQDQLVELEEWRNEAYENSRIYKERAKKIHDIRIRKKEFSPGDNVLLYNSRLRLFPGKLKARWTGRYVIYKCNKNDTFELLKEDGSTFVVNGYRLKSYYKSDKIVEATVTLLQDP